MARWQLFFTFPNLVPPIPSPFEADGLYLCSADDARLRKLAANPGNRTGRRILRRFSTTFGTRYRPGCLVVQDDASDAVKQVEAIRSFRNVCALATTTRSWALSIRHPYGAAAQMSVRWSDHFFFGYHAPGHSGALGTLNGPTRGMDDRIERFRAQSTPYIGLPNHFGVYVDEQLLKRLFMAWHAYHISRRKRSLFRRLFRSLEVAFHASLFPADGFPSVNDVGTRIGLWISAFEILFHPGRDQQVNKRVVQMALQQIPFLKPALRSLRYTVWDRRVRHQATLAEALYDDLYRARNRFFHGEAVTASDLHYRRSTNYLNLIDIAPVLYNGALLSFLRNRIRGGPETAAAIAAGKDIAGAMKRYIEATRGVSEIEDALLAARYRLNEHGHPDVPRR